jgi:hypothetical protein
MAPCATPQGRVAHLPGKAKVDPVDDPSPLGSDVVAADHPVRRAVVGLPVALRMAPHHGHGRSLVQHSGCSQRTHQRRWQSSVDMLLCNCSDSRRPQESLWAGVMLQWGYRAVGGNECVPLCMSGKSWIERSHMPQHARHMGFITQGLTTVSKGSMHPEQLLRGSTRHPHKAGVRHMQTCQSMQGAPQEAGACETPG